MSPEYQLAQALAAALTTAGYPATAYRYRWPNKDELRGEPQISVVPVTAETSPHDRHSNECTATVEIAITQTLPAKTPEALEIPAALADDVAATFEPGGALYSLRVPIDAGTRTAAWSRIQRSPTLRPDLLAKLNLFCAPIRVVFDII